MCGGKHKLLALVTDGKVERRIFELSGSPPPLRPFAPARFPPELELAAKALG